MTASPPTHPSARTSAKSTRLRDEYEQTGMVAQAFELADRSVLPRLLADVAVFRAELDRLRRAGVARVPYIVTEAIRAVAQDPAITAVVQAIFGDGVPFVMWGPNIREATPNQADRWHVDLESWYWPSITVVVGLRGCHTDAATRCIPYSHRLRRGPDCAGDTADTSRVTHAALLRDRRCDATRSPRGFGVGTFYVFDARTWHRGEPSSSADRVALFLHYQRADRPRIPYMRDYDRGLFDAVAAPFIVCGGGRANLRVQSLPWRARLRAWIGTARGMR